ncbi:predicted protein [Naegleria gruberi]|uniref:Predicted protein n=1 Tax=Naegleria gruberi TaxID=5762 RepID=D2VZG1_NAEGR|nr:uncharacterized protein NAEGRDRAFT_59675 [Naegleria gruberi]EFC37786.1 predicted protein [Naegleria gruberi]|eukprot:XP_002670530.1 predicted protein [Naegleria gruberi strain NEG-M]
MGQNQGSEAYEDGSSSSTGFTFNRDYLDEERGASKGIAINKHNNYGSESGSLTNDTPIRTYHYTGSTREMREYLPSKVVTPGSPVKKERISSNLHETSSEVWKKSYLYKLCEQLSPSLVVCIEHWVKEDSDTLTGLCIRYNIDEKVELATINSTGVDDESLSHAPSMFIPVHEYNIQILKSMSKSSQNSPTTSTPKKKSKKPSEEFVNNFMSPELLASMIFSDGHASFSATHLYLHDYYFTSHQPDLTAIKHCAENCQFYRTIDFKHISLVTKISSVKSIASLASGNNVCISKEVFNFVSSPHKHESQFDNLFMVHFKEPKEIENTMISENPERIGVMKSTKLEGNLLRHTLSRQMPILFLINSEKVSEFLETLQDYVAVNDEQL